MQFQDSTTHAAPQAAVHYTPQYVATRAGYTPRFHHDLDGQVPPQGSVVMRPCRLVVRGVPGREGDGLDRAGVRAAVWR